MSFYLHRNIITIAVFYALLRSSWLSPTNSKCSLKPQDPFSHSRKTFAVIYRERYKEPVQEFTLSFDSTDFIGSSLTEL